MAGSLAGEPTAAATTRKPPDTNTAPLRFLAERAGEVVSRQQLLDAVWPGVKVTDDSVVQCIKEIRQALGEDARWIVRTVSRRGYTFMAEVTVVAPSATSPGPAVPSSETGGALGPSVPAQPSEGRRSSPAPARRQRTLLAASVLIGVLACGGLTWQLARPAPPTVLTMMAEPSIAVLPFEALDEGPVVASAARALSDDVVTAMSRTAPGPMMSLKSAASYRSGGDADVRAVGRAVDARYLVLGGVRGEGDALLVNVRLIEAESRRQLWAERVREAPDSRIYTAVRIARMVGVAVLAVESRRPLPATPQAAHYAALALALTGHRERNAAINKTAHDLSKKALELDPDSIPGLVAYARTILTDVLNGWVPSDSHPALLSQTEQALQRAVARPHGHMTAVLDERARLLLARRDLDGAIATYEHALRLNPTFAPLHAQLGRVKIAAGRASETVAHVEEAIRLSPTDPVNYLWYFTAGVAAIQLGDYKAAFEWLQKARQANREYMRPIPWLALAYAGLGREEEGRALIGEYMKVEKGLTIAGWNSRTPRGIPAERRMRIEGLLRRLGVPEGKVQIGSGR